MSEDIVSDYFVTLSLDGGKIRFGESGRAWDERGHDMVVVQLPSQPLMFGEWRPRWAANQNDFDVDIVTFGFHGLLLLAARILRTVGRSLPVSD